MAFPDHPLHQLRVLLHIGKGDEEHRPDVLLFQGIQDGRSVTVFIALVKGEVDALVVGGTHGEGVELVPVYRLEPDGFRGTVLAVVTGAEPVVAAGGGIPLKDAVGIEVGIVVTHFPVFKPHPVCHQHGGKLGTGGGVRRFQKILSLAGNDLVLHGPAQGFFRPVGDITGILKFLEIVLISEGDPVDFRILFQDQSGLFPGDVHVRSKHCLRQTMDDALFIGPGHGTGIVSGRLYIRKGDGGFGRRFSGHTVEDGDHHTPGHGSVRAEGVVVHTGKDTLVVGGVYVVIIPAVPHHVIEGTGAGLQDRRGSRQS